VEHYGTAGMTFTDPQISKGRVWAEAIALLTPALSPKGRGEMTFHNKTSRQRRKV